MDNLISFCINTTKQELEYLKLLFHSLEYNLKNKSHEIIVFVENDTESNDIINFLLEQKKYFVDLKIIKNPLPIPISYQGNINLMFKMAKYDIVSYIQSDMIICPLYDEEILSSLKKYGENIVLSSCRVEPELHPPSPEKITKNFGIYPNEILQNFNAFNTFATSMKNYDKETGFFFAPFTLKNKNLWNDIGGHDTIFRKAREDSDILYRMTIVGYEIKQCWNAIVYHRSCVSSRGEKFFTEEGKKKDHLRQYADMIEMSRFLRKWPKFKHDTKFDPTKEYKYLVSANFKNVTTPNSNDIFENYYRFHHIFIDNESIRSQLRQRYDKFHEVENESIGISNENWDKYKKYYRTWEFDDIFVPEPIKTDDIVLDLDLSTTTPFKDPCIVNLNDIIHNTPEIGQYECGGGILTINRLNNVIRDNLIVKNPPLDDVDFIFL